MTTKGATISLSITDLILLVLAITGSVLLLLLLACLILVCYRRCFVDSNDLI